MYTHHSVFCLIHQYILSLVIQTLEEAGQLIDYLELAQCIKSIITVHVYDSLSYECSDHRMVESC